MSKLQGPDAIMSAAQLKPLLLLSKHGPVSCAIGMTKDKHGVILLDKKAKPRKVMAELRKAAAGNSIEIEASSLRFGTASVTEADGGLVHITVNKEAPAALRPKLVEHLKKAGFGRCEIVVDEALEGEGEEDGAGHGHAAGHHAAPGPDAAALTHRLTTLVRAMAGLGLHGPELDGMKAAAVAAQGALKAGHPAAAEKDIAHLEHLLRAHARHAAPAGHAPAGPTPAAHAAAAAAGKPSLHSKSGQELATLKQLDAAQHEPGAKVMVGGKPVPLAQAVQEMHDHLRRAERFARDLVHKYKDEYNDVPAIRVFSDHCDDALTDASKALNAKPPQLAAAYNHLQTAYLAFDDLQSQLSAERGLTVDNWTACMEGAKSVRTAACTMTVVLATAAFGEAGNAAATVLTKALETGSDYAAGEKVNFGKAGAEIVLTLLLSKMGKPLGDAIEGGVEKWIAAHAGERLEAVAGSEALHSLEAYMAKAAPKLRAGSPEYWEKVREVLTSGQVGHKIAEKAKDIIFEQGKTLFANAAGAIGQPGDHSAKGVVKQLHAFIEEVRSGKHMREDTIPKAFATAAAHVLKH